MKSTRKERADQLLVSRGLARSREAARAMILAGEALLPNGRVEKAGQLLPSDAEIRLARRRRFVSRGGDKLAGALEDFGVEVRGLAALDVGASTGGFTDCLLQSGARHVYAVDVGRAQLAEKLRRDERVTFRESLNARTPFELAEAVDLVVADVSFISLRLVLPSALAHLRPGGRALALVKPQFEAGRGQAKARGVVRDPQVHARVVGGFCLWAVERGLRVLGVRASRVAGETGNREFFVLLRA